MPSYICNRCNKLFNHKNDFRKYRNRNLPCKIANIENNTNDTVLEDEIQMGKKLAPINTICAPKNTNI